MCGISGYDGRVHQGQIVVHEALLSDIRQVFDVILKTRFPVESVLPIAHPVIQCKGPYGLSPDTNNTSGYVWRPIVWRSKIVPARPGNGGGHKPPSEPLYPR